jgi:ATP-dependent RNA circularization protein (DNA/RNA ligase family)
MNKYPKINSIFKRDDNGKFTSEYSCPELEYLKDNQWEFTEKIDGMNIRVAFEEGKLCIGGRTDNAQIPAFLFSKLAEIFASYAEEGMTLYGEGYGSRIQQGGGYISDGVGFILFDVQVGKWWLKREDVEVVAQKYNIPIVPVIGRGTLADAVAWCQVPFPSRVGKRDAEGIVMRPVVQLLERNGERIITKVKVRDFA